MLCVRTVFPPFELPLIIVVQGDLNMTSSMLYNITPTLEPLWDSSFFYFQNQIGVILYNTSIPFKTTLFFSSGIGARNNKWIQTR